MVGSFFLVICVLLAVMLFLKRFNTVAASTGGYIEVLASAPLGQRERAVLLQIGAEQILSRRRSRETSRPCTIFPTLLLQQMVVTSYPLRKCGTLLEIGKG